MDSLIRIISAMIVVIIVFANIIGNFLGVGDLIPTQPEEPLETTTSTTAPVTTPHYTSPVFTLPPENTTAPVPPSTRPAITTTAPNHNIMQQVIVNGKTVFFGCNSEEIISLLGEATEIIYETRTDGRQITNLVYASDYSKLAVYILVDNIFSGFYTVDTSAAISDGNYTYSIASAGETHQSGLRIYEFTDSHNDYAVYAVYASFNGFSIDTASLTNLDGQSKLIFHATNALRAINGIYAYSYCDKATEAIEIHCTDMATRGYFDHFSPEGESVADRLHAQGINYMGCAENIAYGADDAFTFVGMWYNSTSGHRDSLLSTFYNYMGAALAVSSNGTTYSGQVFYKPY